MSVRLFPPEILPTDDDVANLHLHLPALLRALIDRRILHATDDDERAGREVDLGWPPWDARGTKRRTATKIRFGKQHESAEEISRTLSSGAKRI